MKQPLKPDQLIHRLRLMAESGGMITKDRRNVIIEAADMIENQHERIAIMEEGNNLMTGYDTSFGKEGDADEIS